MANPLRWLQERKAARLDRAGRLRQPHASAWGGPGGWAGYWAINLPGAVIDFHGEAGDRRMNAVVAACLNWITTSWTQAPLLLVQDVEGEPQPVDHPALAILDDAALAGALVRDWWAGGGNAYAHVLRAGDGRPVGLEYLPAHCTRPIPDRNNGWLTGYEYNPDGRPQTLPIQDVVHFRFGVDPACPVRGIDPLAAVDREIVADNAAAAYAANLMRSGGMPPAILTPDIPKDGLASPLSPDQAKVLTEQLREKMRDDPGGIRLLSNAVKLIQLAFDPDKMALNEVREQPETRICAAFQLPPIVVGMRAGLQRSTYSNTEEARRAAWQDCIVPAQDYFAAEWTAQFLSLFEGMDGISVAYDRSNIGVLQPDVNALREQARADFAAGLITLEEARAEGMRSTDQAVIGRLEEERAQRQQAAREAFAASGNSSSNGNGTGKAAEWSLRALALAPAGHPEKKTG